MASPKLARWVVAYWKDRGTKADLKVRGKTVQIAIEKAHAKLGSRKLISIRPLNDLAAKIAKGSFGQIAYIEAEKTVRRKPKKMTGRSIR